MQRMPPITLTTPVISSLRLVSMVSTSVTPVPRGRIASASAPAAWAGITAQLMSTITAANTARNFLIFANSFLVF